MPTSTWCAGRWRTSRRVPPQAAWARAFDGATYRRLEHDYEAYFRAPPESGFVAADLRSSADVVRQERVVAAPEMQSLWTHLDHVAHPPATRKSDP